MEQAAEKYDQWGTAGAQILESKHSGSSGTTGTIVGVVGPGQVT